MASARAYSATATATGIIGHLLTIEAETYAGLPVTLLHGFPPATSRERRDRIRAAVVSSGCGWPPGEVTISARPRSQPEPGHGTDLAIAVAAVAASGEIPPVRLRSTMFYGGLRLDGQLRAVPDVVPVLQMAAVSDPFTTVVIPAGAAALTEHRLLGVEKGYFHGEGIDGASARLVDRQAGIDITADWGGGLVASVDGMRFVVPVRSLHSRPSPLYWASASGRGARPG
jgi:hypothetical protein